MLGTGTQLDPYQITTVAEFRGMNNSSAYFKLMNDLDVNDSEWASEWAGVTLAFKEFDGDGHEIWNINYDGISRAITINASDVTIKRANFNNFIAAGNDSCFYKYTPGTLCFDECNFAIDTNTSYVFNVDGSTSYVVFNRCALTLSGVVHNRFNRLADSGNIMTNCHINLANLKLPKAISGSQGLAFINLNATRVSILGSVTKNTADTSGWFSQASQCFVAVDMADSAYRPTVFSHSDPASSCFYDKDLMGAIMTAQTNVHALTTAQCKDKDYLNSIGFVVV